MKGRWLHMAVLLCCLWCFQGCTKIDLCEEGEHPHQATLHPVFHWQGAEQQKPEEMLILSNRTYNTWRYAFVWITERNKGYELESEEETPEANTRQDTDEEGEEETGENQPDEQENPVEQGDSLFRIKTGEYQFFTVNYNEQFEIYPLQDYLSNGTASRDVTVRYKEIARKDLMEQYDKDWTDFNPGYSYLTHGGRIFCDRLFYQSIYAGEEETLNFYPQLLTQELTIEFRLEPEAEVVIEDVLVELSGISRSVALSTGYIQFGTTHKMVFRPDYTGQEGDQRIYTGTLIVPGLRAHTDPVAITGPGILQLAIYTQAEGRRKTFYAGVNLSRTIGEANLLTASVDSGEAQIAVSEATLQVKQVLKLDKESILWSSDEEHGIDTWFESKKIDIDV